MADFGVSAQEAPDLTPIDVVVEWLIDNNVTSNPAEFAQTWLRHGDGLESALRRVTQGPCVLDVECPRCSVRPGQQCVWGDLRRPWKRVHSSRHERWREERELWRAQEAERESATFEAEPRLW